MENPYLKKELKHFLHTFKRQPLLIKKAAGEYVWDASGRKYLDMYSGLAVCGVGHNQKSVVRAIKAQASRLIHSSNFFYTEPQLALAEQLTKRWSGSRVFFANSGAEANEAAVKLARLWAAKNSKPGRTVITFNHSFHGRTLAMAAASGGYQRWGNDVFAPLPEGFKSVPYNDVSALRDVIDQDVIAVMLEPVQGEGGIHVATREFFSGIAELCRKNNLLLICDEIQSGMGRTGTFFAFEQYGVKPDIVTLAKGLAGGMPLSATLCQENVAQHMAPGLHGTTFGGNPVSCAASLEVLKLLGPSALTSIKKAGDYWLRAVKKFSRFPVVREIRAHGLMMGIDLTEDGRPYVDEARERGLLINCTQNTVLRLLPPYFMRRANIDRAIAVLEQVFAAMKR